MAGDGRAPARARGHYVRVCLGGCAPRQELRLRGPKSVTRVVGEVTGLSTDSVRWTRVSVDLDAIAHNVRELKRVARPGSELMAVVKADGYGHGAVQVAAACLRAGATRLAVAIAEEGRELREAGITAPILILGATPPERAREVVAYDLAAAVFTPELALALAAAAAERHARAKIHLKIETGMGRLGLPPGDALRGLAQLCRDLDSLDIEGVFSHLALADSADKSFSQFQRANFERALADLAAVGVRPVVRHLANSAATIELPDFHYEVVRPGISLYGYQPGDEVARRVDLRPALSWTTRVAWVKEVPAGTAIGYGCTYVTREPTRIATLPVGYADGYPRALSNRGEVLIRGRRAPVVGRVCMDQIMVDVGHIPGVTIGDEVVLIGAQGAERITADDLAKKVGTISYEILTSISKRVPRIYLRGEASSA